MSAYCRVELPISAYAALPIFTANWDNTIMRQKVLDFDDLDLGRRDDIHLRFNVHDDLTGRRQWRACQCVNRVNQLVGVPERGVKSVRIVDRGGDIGGVSGHARCALSYPQAQCCMRGLRKFEHYEETYPRVQPLDKIYANPSFAKNSVGHSDYIFYEYL